ncbi:MAG: transposase [Elusimicrobia bacterium]|nr:transposase [Elusimicrobiota bacterium]
MPRQSRLYQPGSFRHVIMRGNGRQDIFLDDADRRRMLRLIFVAAKRTKTQVHGYCLMTNHVHLLVRQSEEELGKMMKEVEQRYAQYFNTRRQTDGHVFQGRFKDFVCHDDSRLLKVLRYIHRNPIKHGAVGHLDDWEWSSHQAYLGRRPSFVITEYCLALFKGSREPREAYLRFMSAKADAPWPHKGRRRSGRMPRFTQDPTKGPVWLPPVDVPLERFCSRLGIPSAALRGSSKERRVSDFRRKFALEALRDGYSLTDVARALRRAKQTVHRLVD